MFRKFITSSIGMSLIFAVLIIGGGVALKISQEKPKNEIRAKIDLIAKESLKNAIDSGQLDTSEWEEVLLSIQGTTTADDAVANISDSESDDQKNAQQLNATDRFAQAFLTKYVKFKESGGVLDENTTIQLVNELLIEDYGGPENEKVYTEEDITIINNPTLIDLKRYGNLLGMAIDQPAPYDYENEMALINMAYESGDTSYLDKLPQNIARYKAIRSQAESIAVPRALKDAHIALLNAFSAIIEGVTGMTLIDADPVAATKMILRYEDGIKTIDPVTDLISTYFKNMGVTFSSDESGYLFNK